MEFFTEPPGSEILTLGAIIVGALMAAWLARILVHGIVKALLDREATEGTAQELSAVELRKRMDTLDSLGAHVIRVHRGDRGAHGARRARLRYRTGHRRPRRHRDCGRLRRPGLRPRLPQRGLILIENQFAKGDVVRIAGVAGTVEDFSLRRTTLRDLDGVVHTVPNGEIKVASNLTRVWARINQDVTIAHGTEWTRRSTSSTGSARRWRRTRLEAAHPREASGRRVEAIDDSASPRASRLGASRRPMGGGG